MYKVLIGNKKGDMIGTMWRNKDTDTPSGSRVSKQRCWVPG